MLASRLLLRRDHSIRLSRDPATRWRGDDLGVSEVIGYTLTFGIISAVLGLSILAFGEAQETTTEAVVEARAESVAQRVAGVLVDAALFAERHGSDSAFRVEVVLPELLEGRSYTVHLDAVGDVVRVEVPSLGVNVSAALFSASAPSSVDACDVKLTGGPLVVRYDSNPSGGPPATCLFLEEA